MAGGTLTAPFSSVTYGSAGIALGLLCIAQREGDAVGLATADAWSCRSARERNSDGAFHNADIEITPNTVGHGSPYHSQSGVHATAALIARAMADIPTQMDAAAAFVDAARHPLIGLDLVVGTSSLILGSAILMDAASGLPGDWTYLRAFGEDTLGELWQTLDSKPSIRDSDIKYLGIAHGWAGFLFATLQWCRISRTAIPNGVIQRLEEMSALSIPAGRGLEWPWVLDVPGDPPAMSGWCNGSSGQVFLWSLAHKVLADGRWLAMAEGAAWNSWESGDPAPTLCCGLVGRAYALLNFFRHTGDPVWLARARQLADRAARNGAMPPEYPHSLFKGEFGLAVLAADLEVPDEAVMPFFEPFGYSAAELV
jgi:serine/threonine-protein kinase